MISLDKSPTNTADIPKEAKPETIKTITGRINHTISKLGRIIINLFSLPSRNKNIVTTTATMMGTNMRTDQRSLNPISKRLEPLKENIIYTCAGAVYY